MSGRSETATTSTSRPKLSIGRVVGLAFLAIGLTASVTSSVAAQQGHSDQSHQLGGLTPLALLGWLVVGLRFPKAQLAAGFAVGLTWISLGIWLSGDVHSAGPYVLAGGVTVCALAGILFIVAVVRRRRVSAPHAS